MMGAKGQANHQDTQHRTKEAKLHQLAHPAILPEQG
jgi:hypothetical protein